MGRFARSERLRLGCCARLPLVVPRGIVFAIFLGSILVERLRLGLIPQSRFLLVCCCCGLPPLESSWGKGFMMPTPLTRDPHTLVRSACVRRHEY